MIDEVWGSTQGPFPLWTPSGAAARTTNLAQFMASLEVSEPALDCAWVCGRQLVDEMLR